VIDLIVNLLQFNPNHRLTADQVLRHPYVKQFAGKGSEILANKVFRIKNDDQKLTTKDYKALIYENIK
jgi:mitogen-activated protein kinase 15